MSTNNELDNNNQNLNLPANENPSSPFEIGNSHLTSFLFIILKYIRFLKIPLTTVTVVTKTTTPITSIITTTLLTPTSFTMNQTLIKSSATTLLLNTQSLYPS